jgi:hypothetical protein
VQLALEQGFGSEEVLAINAKSFRAMKKEVAGFQKYLSIFTRLHVVTCRKAVFRNYFNGGRIGYAKSLSGDCQCLAENYILKIPEAETSL